MLTFILVVAFVLSYSYAFLECRLEHDQGPLGFEWPFSFWIAWQDWSGVNGRRLVITVQNRRLIGCLRWL